MVPKIRNIIIFVAIAVILVLIYVFFIRSSSDNSATLIAVPANPGLTTVTGTGAVDANSAIAQDFLTLLLSVKNIKLNDSIFSDPAFASLIDTPIDLTPDGTEGRPNPFAPLGNDVIVGTEAVPAPADTAPNAPPSITPVPSTTPVSGTNANPTRVNTAPPPAPTPPPTTNPPISPGFTIPTIPVNP